jgi:hypothetical protein
MPVIRFGGYALVGGAVAFLAVFTYLAAVFNYPEVLDGRAADVLPALLATGDTGRAVWAFYALLPLCWIPAGVAAFHALRGRSDGVMRIASLFAFLSAITMIAGLIRWPSFHWELARAWVADPAIRPELAAVFAATNRYLGNYVGEFLGELCIGVFFLLSAVAMLKEGSGFARWIGWAGVIASAAGLMAMFRNITPAVSLIAEVNNYVLPAWMIVFGVSLIRYRAVPVIAATTPMPAPA